MRKSRLWRVKRLAQSHTWWNLDPGQSEFRTQVLEPENIIPPEVQIKVCTLLRHTENFIIFISQTLHRALTHLVYFYISVVWHIWSCVSPLQLQHLHSPPSESGRPTKGNIWREKTKSETFPLLIVVWTLGLLICRPKHMLEHFSYNTSSFFLYPVPLLSRLHTQMGIIGVII